MPARKFRSFMTNIFARYILPSILIMALIFSVLGAYMFRYFENTLMRRSVDSTMNSLNQIRTAHESNMDSMYNIVSQAAFSPGMTPFELESHADRAYSIKQLLSMFNINDGIFDQIIMTYVDDAYYYTSRTSCHEEMFYQNGLICENLSADHLRALIETTDELTCIPISSASGIIPVATGKYVLFISPFGQGNLYKYGSLIFMVPDRVYQNLFAQITGFSRNIYITQQERVISSHCDFDIPQPYLMSQLPEETGTNRFEYEGVEYLIVSLSSVYNDMRYTALLSVDQMLMDGRGEQRMFWSLLAGLIVLCLIVIVFFSYQAHSPVKRLRNMFIGQSEMPDKLDDFDIIETGIHSLIGQNTELSTQVDSGRISLRSRLILDLVKKRFDTREQFASAAAQAGLNAIHPCYAFVLTAASETARQVAVPMLPALEQNPCGVVSELLAQDQLIFLIFADTPDKIFSWGDQVLAALRAQGSKSPVAISSVQTDLSKADACYMEAAAAYDARFIMGGQNTLRFDLLSDRLNAPAAYPASLIELLERAILSGDASAVNVALDAIFNHLKSMPLSLHSFRCIYRDILVVIQHADTQSDTPASDVFTLAACQNIDDLDVALRDACKRLLRRTPQASEKSAQEEAAPADEIARFMRENYSNDALSMAMISEKFGLSTVKLSLLFKEAMGMSPSDYLTMVRINSACELLRDTDYSIKQISAMVGYNDVSSFTRRFKATTAMTPLNYRNSTIDPQSSK